MARSVRERRLVRRGLSSHRVLFPGQHELGDASAAAAAAVVVVSVVGLLVSRQLSEVPENTIKTVVGIMLTSFGIFWVCEGAGVRWPGSDLAISVLVGVFALVTAAGVVLMKSLAPVAPGEPALAPAEPDRRPAPWGA